jgi:hypothetical protein
MSLNVDTVYEQLHVAKVHKNNRCSVNQLCDTASTPTTNVNDSKLLAFSVL